MDAITHNDLKMKFDRLILASYYLLNVPVWLLNLPAWFKAGIFGLSALTGMMAFMNQWASLKKNYKTLWVVITVNHMITFIKPRPKQKKNRHRNRGISINKNQNQDQDNDTNNTNIIS